MRHRFAPLIVGLALAAPAAAADDPRRLIAAPPAPCAAVPATPLTLPDLVDLALCANPATAVAYAASRSAAANVGIARAADLPSVSATVGPTLSRTDYFRSQQVAAFGGQSFGAATSSTDLGSSASLALSYLLFDFGGRAARIDAARAQQRAAISTVADTAQSVALTTITAYNSLQGNLAAVTAAQATVAFNRSSFDLADAKRRAGVSTPADALQARTSLAQAELTLAQARGNARTAAGQLAVAVGAPPTVVLTLAPAPPLASADVLTRDVATLIADAERLRPDLTTARANRDAAVAQVRAARSDLRPSVSATAQDNLGYADTTTDSNRATVGLTLSLPLFDGYGRTYRVAAARAEAERQAALLEQTRQQAGLDVYTQATALTTAIAVLATARELINSATASADIAQGRFKAGVGTFTDLLNAQSALASARQQLVSADFGVRDAQARLARAVGAIGDAVDGMREKQVTRRRWIIVAIVALAALAWFGWTATHRPDPAAAFATQTLALGDLSEVITANGVINPVRVVSVGTQVSGTVAKLNVDYNSRVALGQVLCELDPSVYAARVAASEATLANVRSTLALTRANAARSAELFKQNYISRQDFETTQQTAASAAAQVAAASAQIKQDRTNLGYTIIRSPVSGVVISRQVDLGQTVAASFSTPTLFTIARDLTEMQIEAAVAEADVAKVRIGQAVTFTVDAYGSRSFTGTVRQIRLNPVTQQNVVTYTVIVHVANPDGALLPGMTANATFLVSDHRQSLLIPNAALSYKPADYRPAKRQAGDAGTLTVFTLVGSAPAPRRIRIGASDADFSIVTGGELHAGDRVITADSVKGGAKGMVLGPPGSQPVKQK